MNGINKEVSIGKQMDCAVEMISSTDVTDSEMFLFLGGIVQMEHDSRDRLRDCWLTAEQYLTLLYTTK
jgi:hypothetical protein